MDLLAAIDSSARLAESTKRTYRGAVQQYIAFTRGEHTGATVERWQKALAAKRDDGSDGLDPTTIYKMVSAVKLASRRCCDLGFGPDFARAAEFPKRPSWTPKEAGTKQEVFEILAICEADRSPRGLRDLAVIVVLVLLGLRRGEVRSLTVGAFKNGHLLVNRKGGWQQRVGLDSRTRVAIEAWLAVRGGRKEEPMFTSIRPSVDDRFRPGSGLSAAGVAHIVDQRARQAGIKRSIRPHALRHSFVSLALDAGVPAHRVMVAAGHRSLATTSRYISDEEQDESPVGESISAHIGGDR